MPLDLQFIYDQTIPRMGQGEQCALATKYVDGQTNNVTMEYCCTDDFDEYLEWDVNGLEECPYDNPWTDHMSMKKAGKALGAILLVIIIVPIIIFIVAIVAIIAKNRIDHET